MRLRTHLRFRDDNVDPGGGGGGGGGGNTTPVAPTRPDGLPDDYWDVEKGVKFDALLPQLKAYSDYRAQVPTKAEEIDWTLPANLDPDDTATVYEFDKDDPLLGEVTKLALEHGATKPFLSAIAAAYARQQINATKQARELLKAEEKKLGDKVGERIAGAMAYVAGVVGKEKAERFRNTWVTAEQVEIIEALAKHAAGPAGGGPTDPTNSRAPGELPTDERERARLWAERGKKA